MRMLVRACVRACVLVAVRCLRTEIAAAAAATRCHRGSTVMHVHACVQCACTYHDI